MMRMDGSSNMYRLITTNRGSFRIMVYNPEDNPSLVKKCNSLYKKLISNLKKHKIKYKEELVDEA